MKKKYLTFVYLLANILLIGAIGFFDPHLKDIGMVFKRIDLPWILGAVLCMLIFWLFDAMIIRYSLASITGTQQFIKSVKISLIGKYYNAVTPFASGGQPCQIYYMIKSGIPAGYASSSLIIKFIIYQGVLSVYAVIAFIYNAAFMRSYSTFLFWAAVVGFVFNFGGPVLIYVLSVREGLVQKILFILLAFLHRIHLVKELDKTKGKLMTHVRDFHNSITLMNGNIKAIVVMVFMTTLEILALLSIPYFIYRGCGLTEAAWVDIVFAHIFLYMAVSFFPTPGASGASEGGFYVLFQLFFARDIIFVSMLLWRLISYYMTIIIGGIFILFSGIRGLYKAPVQDV